MSSELNDVNPAGIGEAEPTPARKTDGKTPGSADGPGWAGVAFGLAAVIVPAFLTEFSSLAVAATIGLMGLIVLLFPPKFRPGLFPSVCLGILCLAPLAGLLPQSWAGAEDAWRVAFREFWDVPLADTISSQPGITLGAILFLWTGAVFWTASISEGHGMMARRHGMQVLSIGIALICLAGIADVLGWFRVGWWPRNQTAWGQGIGPFANRNHFATLAAVGMVLCMGCAHDALRRRSRGFLIFVASFFPCAVAIVLNTSRAGLLLSMLGVMMWVGFVAMRSGLLRKLAAGTALALLAVAIVSLSQTSLSQRLGFGETKADLSSNTRLQLYGECLRLTMERPWSGFGLGNFEPVFNHLSKVSNPRTTFAHPESDFFDLLFEGGIGMALPAIGLVGWLMIHTGPWKLRKAKRTHERLDRRMRQTASIAAGLMLLHGIVDVPLHGIRFFVIFACICGFAMPRRLLTPVAGAWGPWAFRAAGAALLIHACWIAGFGPPGPSAIPSNLSAETLYRDAAAFVQTRKFADSRASIEKALQMKPLDWRFYYLRAQLRLASAQDTAGAIQDFGRARFLEPHYAAMCEREGQFWLGYEPAMAIPAWREAIQRHPEVAAGTYGRLSQWVAWSMPYPKLWDSLWDLAATPALKLAFLHHSFPPDEWKRRLSMLLSDPDAIEMLSEKDREDLFKLWHQRGNREQLMMALQQHPEWQGAAWRLLAEDLASKSRFKEAYELVSRWLPQPTPPGQNSKLSLGELERAFVFSPTDARTGMELYWAQMRLNLHQEALYTLQKLEGLPNAPAYLPQEFASVHAAMGEYRLAWEFIRKVAQIP